MTPNVCWLGQQEKHNLKPMGVGAEWKNFMSEVLLKTELPVKENGESKVNCLDLSPNIVMDTRHAMARTQLHLKETPIPKEIVQTEAARFLREENRKQLLKRKQDVLVLKEIETLIKVLEDYKMVKKKEEILNHCRRTTPKMKSFNARLDAKMNKRFEEFRKTGNCRRRFSAPISPVHSLKESGISLEAVKQKELEDVFSRPVSRNKKGSETNSEYEGKQNFNESTREFIKNEIMKRFFESQIEESKVDEDNESYSNQNIKKDKNEPKLKRAWKAWRIYTLARRKIRREKIEHEDKIEKFLEKLQKEPQVVLKKSFSSRKPETNSQQSKLKYQNVEEKRDRREKKIQDIMKDVEKSKKETYESLVDFEKHKLERNEKVTVLKTLLNVKQDHDGIKVFPYPKFLLRMEKRREELINRRRDIRERKQKLEEERVLEEKQKEEEMKVAKELEKRNNLEKIREKRRQEKEKKQKKKEEIEKAKLYSQIADEHYRGYVVRRFGFEPWLGLMNLRRCQWKAAEAFNRIGCLKKAFSFWKEVVKKRIEEKQTKAKRLYSIALKRRCFSAWNEIREEAVRKYQVAADWNDLRVVDRMFGEWIRFTRNEQIEELEKVEEAESYYEKKLKSCYLEKWKNYPAVKKLEIAKEKRKQVWRELVQEVLPDYRPNCIEIDS